MRVHMGANEAHASERAWILHFLGVINPPSYRRAYGRLRVDENMWMRECRARAMQHTDKRVRPKSRNIGAQAAKRVRRPYGVGVGPDDESRAILHRQDALDKSVARDLDGQADLCQDFNRTIGLRFKTQLRRYADSVTDRHEDYGAIM